MLKLTSAYCRFGVPLSEAKFDPVYVPPEKVDMVRINDADGATAIVLESGQVVCVKESQEEVARLLSERRPRVSRTRIITIS